MRQQIRHDGKFTTHGLSRKRGPELLAHFGAVLSDQLEKAGQEPHKASEIAIVIMERLRDEFGGQNVYFPRGFYAKAEEKASTIYDKWKAGTTIDELAHEYSHSIQWIYRLIADERARRRVEHDAEIESRRAAEHERWKREN